MKKLILIFCLSLFYQIYGQAPKDTLFTLKGKALAGEYVRIDQKSIYFKIDGSKNVSTLPKDKIDKVLLKTGILLTASALPLIAKEDASGLTLEKDGEQVLIPLDEWVVVSSAYGFINTVRGLYIGMTVDALRIQEKGESFEREIPMDEIGLIVTGKTKSTRDYVFQGMRIACIGTMGGVLLLGIIEPSDNSNFFGLGRGFMYALAGIYTSIFTVPAGALIGFMNAQVAEGKAVEYVIGDGEWVIVK
jgi:hypothetical protein